MSLTRRSEGAEHYLQKPETRVFDDQRLAWARLGPFSPALVLPHATGQTVGRDCSSATAHPIGWLSGFPTGRPWVSLSRVLFLGSLDSCVPLPEHPNLAGPDAMLIGGLSPRGAPHHLRRR
jgi:hypothetical protein